MAHAATKVAAHAASSGSASAVRPWLRAFKACEMELPPGDERTEGSYANRAVALQTPEGKLRVWVEDHYVHVPLREKDTGTKLEALYAAYTACMPPVHTKVLGRNTFGKMLNAVYWPAQKRSRHN
jgi:hypothetical protein